MINWLKNEADKLREMIQGRRQLFAYLMFVGFICHGYMFLNKLPNFDDTVALTSKGTTLAAGRWFLPFTTIITNGISIPLFIGIFSITCIIISCFIVCDLLGITKGINIFAAGCLMICFPTITGTFTFMYTTDSYMLGLLFAALAVWIVVKTEKFVPILGGGSSKFFISV